MVETGRGILKNTKDLFYQEVEKRFSNPFLGAFILAWILCNWDFIYIILFLDEQYVSFSPEILNGSHNIFTKYEYIKDLGIVNWWRFIFYPLIASFIFVIFVELGTTYLNLGVKYIKEKIIEKREIIVKEEYEKLKDEFVQVRKKYREKAIIQNDEIISLQAKNDEIEFSINDKVNYRLKEEEIKNIKRIKELEGKLDSTLKIADERLEENKFLINKNNQLSQSITGIKDRDNIYENEISLLMKDRNAAIERFTNIQKENFELKKKIAEINKPIEDIFKEDYKDFKNNSHFDVFGDLIDAIESQPYILKQKFIGKYLKYLTLKGIIEELHDENDRMYYNFTSKGDRFVELYLDETFIGSGKKNIRKPEEFSIEDLPF